MNMEVVEVVRRNYMLLKNDDKVGEYFKREKPEGLFGS